MQTVKNHISRLPAKLGVQRRVQAAVLASHLEPHDSEKHLASHLEPHDSEKHSDR
ncbi:hypothetical protein ACF07Y_23365 [Streptomyces sp. NPDC016566]|uniref:hypothetical protein n=1 Tax=Streptomyces sp. NPDC016566 TaxID=3364967 RepID=UPI003701C255